MASVFVSHAREDRELTREIHDWLKTEGHRVFVDTDARDGIKGGEDWKQRLIEELHRAEAVLCLVTDSFIRSKWCTTEVAIAHTLGKRILPVIVHRADPRDVPLLNHLHYVSWDEERGARDKITEILRELDTGLVGAVPSMSPFPGLQPYDQGLAWAYIGREREVVELADILRSPAVEIDKQMVVVVGPSGCGKSSLVQAGVGPELSKDPNWWVLPVITPGEDPIGSLTAALVACGRGLGLDWTMSSTRSRLESSIGDNGDMEPDVPAVGLLDLVEDLISARRMRRRARALLIIDQLEEIFTRAHPTAQARFAGLLSKVLTGRMRILATLRSEFLGPYQRSAELSSIPLRSFLLPPLAEPVLHSVVEVPARRAGISVSRDLVDALVSDTGDGNALPLLAFTLNQLADGIRRGGGLSMDRYITLGGVTGALRGQAELAMSQRLSAGRTRKEVLDSLLNLVTVDEEGLPARKRVEKDALSAEVREDLDAFDARRLLTTGDLDGRTYVSVAHERFITDWAPLAEAVSEQSIALRMLRELEQAAVEWDRADRAVDYLWSHGRLSLAFPDGLTSLKTLPLFGRIVTSPQGPVMNSLTRAFVTACRKRARLRMISAITASLIVIVTLSVTTAVAVSRSQAAEQERLLAISRGLVDRADSVRNANPLLALQLGIAADNLKSTGDTRSSLLETLVATSYAGRTLASMKTVTSLALAPDDSFLAAADGTRSIGLWAVGPDGRLLPYGQPLEGGKGINAVVFTADSQYLIAGQTDGGVSVWNTRGASRSQPVVLLPAAHVGAITAMSLSPDGRTLATAGSDRTVLLWSMDHPEKPSRVGTALVAQLGPIQTVAFSPDAKILATGSADGTFALWSLADREHPFLLRIFHGDRDRPTPIRVVRFSPDKRTLAVAAGERVTLWDVQQPSNAHPYDSQTINQTEPVTAIAFSPSGDVLAAGDRTHAVRLWDTRNPMDVTDLGRPLNGHAESVDALAFSANGKLLVSGAEDGVIFVWDLRQGPLIRRVGEVDDAGTPSVVEASPLGSFIAVGSNTGAVQLWDLRNPASPTPVGAPLTGHSGRVTALAFSPDGSLLATGSYDRTIRLWDVQDPAAPKPLGTPLAGHTNVVTALLFAAPDVLASSGYDGSLILWNTDARKATGVGTTDNGTPLLSLSRLVDGGSLAGLTTGGTILMWEVSDPRRPRRVSELHTDEDTAVSAIEVPQDGTDVVAVSTSERMYLWDAANPNLPRRLGDPVHTGTGPVSMAFDQPEEILVTVRATGTIDLWTLSMLKELRGHLLRYACDRAVQGLSEIDWERYVPGLTYRRTCP